MADVSGADRVFQKCRVTTVNVADDSTTVYTGRCFVFGVYVNTVLSAHACPIQDGSTAKITLPASLAAGTNIQFGGVGIEFGTSLVVDPDNSGTGNISILWTPAE